MAAHETEEWTAEVGDADVEPGVYEGTLINVERTDPIETQYADGAQVFDRWTWGIDLPSGEATELDELSSLSKSSRSKRAAILTALVGQEKAFGMVVTKADVIGGRALLTIERTENGFPRIAGHTAMPKGK